MRKTHLLRTVPPYEAREFEIRRAADPSRVGRRFLLALGGIQRSAFLGLAGLILTMLSACSETPPKPVQKPSGPQFSKSSQDGRFVVDVDSKPRPMPTNDHFSMTIDITAKDKAVDLGAIDIEVDADMPEHKHGMNTRPIVKKTAPGKFVAEGMLLHMPGRWEISVVLKDDKNWTERLMFEHIAD